MRLANTEFTVPAEIFINGRFLAQRLSGVQRFARELLLALDELLAEGVIDRDRFRLTVLQPRSVAEPAEYRHIAMRSIGRYNGHLWEQTELPAHVRGKLLLNFCNTAPLLKRNQLLTIHDAAVRAVPKAYTRAFRAWYHVMHALVGARAARIVTVSKFSKRELGDRLGISAERIAVVSGGSDHILRVARDPSILGRFDLERRPFVLAVSSLSPHKNFGAAAQAFQIARLPDFDFVVAGSANPHVFAAHGASLPPSVKHLGAVSDGELRALYERAACFVFPSLYEGFGLPPLEAMACGCPVLAANAASLPEVCGDGVLYCDPRSPADIAAKLGQILTDKALRARLCEHGRARAAQFTWHRCAREVWQQILLTLGETPCASRTPGARSGRPPVMNDMRFFGVAPEVIEPQARAGRLSDLRVAVVHEWLVDYSGSERVVEQILRLFPHADLFAVVEFLPAELKAFIQHKPVKTTFIQWLPGARTRYRSYLPLMPLAVEQHDLSAYDLVLSSSHAVAKGVLTGPYQLHVCYMHTPIRYAWDLQHQYLREARLDSNVKGWLARLMLHRLRMWDLRTANGVDHFLANSHFIRRRIEKVYRRDAHVVYPPVEVETSATSESKDSFYLTASRMTPYKRVDLVVEAFARIPQRRLVVIGDGPSFDQVKAKATSNVELLGFLPTAELREMMRRARAFVFAAEEDFGITVVEAQAHGTPVIAFGRGGVTEIVRGLDSAQPTGVFFREQTAEAIVAAVQKFEANAGRISAEACRENAVRFSPVRFRQEYGTFIENAWTRFASEQRRF